jgi:hypothetical protein
MIALLQNILFHDLFSIAPMLFLALSWYALMDRI